MKGGRDGDADKKTNHHASGCNLSIKDIRRTGCIGRHGYPLLYICPHSIPAVSKHNAEKNLASRIGFHVTLHRTHYEIYDIITNP